MSEKYGGDIIIISRSHKKSTYVSDRNTGSIILPNFFFFFHFLNPEKYADIEDEHNRIVKSAADIVLEDIIRRSGLHNTDEYLQTDNFLQTFK